MGDLLDDYDAPGWDELFESPGVARPGSTTLLDALQALSSADFARRCEARDRAFRDQGITFSLSGEERPFPLDLVPRMISPEEWSVIEEGVIQRVRALEAFLADVYGGQQVLHDGVVPAAVVTSSRHFHRQAMGIEPPNGVRAHVAGIDLARGGDGRFCVLEDNLRTPSGISYVVENRRTMARVFPDLFASQRVRPVDSYPARLLEALRAASPVGSADPVVVVLTPGVHNPAYFEHTFLARQMGVELVEGRDLVCRDNVVYMRSTEGEQRVDVVYRRVDDEWLDPLQFEPSSVVGSPGILNAARAGNVALASAVGNGVADDKLVYSYVPALIRYYLGQEPVLDNVVTYRLNDPDQLAHVLGRLDELVLKPVDGSGGVGLVIGPHASDAELAVLAAQVRAAPRQWTAQEVVALSTAPTLVGDRLRPRHVDLRPFAVNDGEKVWVVPGGLTRVALDEGNLVVNSSRGGGSKDTWVLASASAGGSPPLTAVRPAEDDGPRRSPIRSAPRPDRGPEVDHDEAAQHAQAQQ
ncbi:MAG: circularly permuted type 2 ATP-grasp protein [Acidimicrobiales bacterium]